MKSVSHPPPSFAGNIERHLGGEFERKGNREFDLVEVGDIVDE